MAFTGSRKMAKKLQLLGVKFDNFSSDSRKKKTVKNSGQNNGMMAKILTLSRKIYYSVETLIQQLLSNFFSFRMV